MTGIQTTLPFDRELLRDEAFLLDDGGVLSTDWVGQRWDASRSRQDAREAALEVAAEAFAEPSTSDASLRKDRDPRSDWRRTGLEAAIDRWPR